MSEQIIERTKRLISGQTQNDLEIGMSVPGLVDQTAGKIFHIPYFDWRNWDICPRLETATGLRVTVENDANATALAEL
ncbi:ROK family protein, partial [Escherichia coli]|nr:ROK family protein [Escherichia coli]